MLIEALLLVLFLGSGGTTVLLSGAFVGWNVPFLCGGIVGGSSFTGVSCIATRENKNYFVDHCIMHGGACTTKEH